MSSRSLVATAFRRSGVTRRPFHVTALRQGGGHSPPLAPFARVTPQSESMTENLDAVWNDGVAPELALDFDMPNTSSKEALFTWMGTLTGFFVLYQGISLVTNGAKDNNPALSHATDVVVPDYSKH
ncbi:hypothetical protein FisN_15Lh312 [Fistulifera solaris]|uniref:Uncharacterized protein n=1 Tax=Fistulifera solaris TaxID=1519565 RepID=A0A1Z5JWH9_FISSO|nr:hypothetical protein FisN_15Lh312 [Fistulifera solaris]|eukprot:GAX18393.1 hypothetical protein FisN_15Lh312 [Fistulifera solaris]